MYYEEQVIDGVLCYRGTPDGDWVVMTPQQLTNRLTFVERYVNIGDRVWDAFRRVRDHESKLPVEVRDKVAAALKELETWKGEADANPDSVPVGVPVRESRTKRTRPSKLTPDVA